ncbi:Major facilitator superfamily domain general substrate transporter [Penicillium cf. viridicatum]|uniref:Major facilitator superfamily domain general substrate transporter n=1 Tax=Penicillium cf. viridicatum TaxID=2972119 RepID=A0A9W9SXV2_9EURO|nr:Major facilitator superfamily domain general substrate transporter [Penicillium cf. viridicatum]
MASKTIIGCSYARNRFASPLRPSVKNVNDTSLAIGQFLAIRLFRGLVSLTISSAIFNNVFSLTGALAPLKDASNTMNFIYELRSLDISFTMLDQVLRVYLKCFQTIFYTMTSLGGLGLLTSVFLDEINLKGQGLGNQRFEE